MRSILLRFALTVLLFAAAAVAGAVANDLLRNQPGAFGQPAFVAVLAAGIRPIWFPWDASFARRWGAFAAGTLAGALEVILAGRVIGALAWDTITISAAATLSGISAVLGTVLAVMLSQIVLRQLHFPGSVNLERSQRAALRLYTTDDLRRLYQAEPGGSWQSLVRLRDDNIGRDQLRAVILWRIWQERFGYFVLLAVSAIGAIAAVVAAVEGWKE